LDCLVNGFVNATPHRQTQPNLARRHFESPANHHDLPETASTTQTTPSPGAWQSRGSWVQVPSPPPMHADLDFDGQRSEVRWCRLLRGGRFPGCTMTTGSLSDGLGRQSSPWVDSCGVRHASTPLASWRPPRLASPGELTVMMYPDLAGCHEVR
jgi:hypothetical protein